MRITRLRTAPNPKSSQKFVKLFRMFVRILITYQSRIHFDFLISPNILENVDKSQHFRISEEFVNFS